MTTNLGKGDEQIYLGFHDKQTKTFGDILLTYFADMVYAKFKMVLNEVFMVRIFLIIRYLSFKC